MNFDSDFDSFAGYNSDSEQDSATEDEGKDETLRASKNSPEEPSLQQKLTKDEQEAFEKMRALYRKDCTIRVPTFSALDFEAEPLVGISIPIGDVVSLPPSTPRSLPVPSLPCFSPCTTFAASLAASPHP